MESKHPKHRSTYHTYYGTVFKEKTMKHIFLKKKLATFEAEVSLCIPSIWRNDLASYTAARFGSCLVILEVRYMVTSKILVSHHNFEFVSGIQGHIDVDVLPLTSAKVCHISKP